MIIIYTTLTEFVLKIALAAAAVMKLINASTSIQNALYENKKTDFFSMFSNQLSTVKAVNLTTLLCVVFSEQVELVLNCVCVCVWTVAICTLKD